MCVCVTKETTRASIIMPRTSSLSETFLFFFTKKRKESTRHMTHNATLTTTLTTTMSGRLSAGATAANPATKGGAKLRTKRTALAAFPSSSSSFATTRRMMMMRTRARRREQMSREGEAFSTTRRTASNEEKPAMQQKVLTKFLELPAVPIGQYVSSPTSYVHKMDSRIKQAWLMAVLLCPSMANEPVERVCVCILLVVVSATSLPRKVWGVHTRNLGALALVLFVFVAIGSDGVPLLTQPREPAPVLEGLENVEGIALATSYKYAILNFGPIHVTRRGVTIATNAACVTFTALQSAYLALCTTTPESLAFAMRWYLTPLKKVFKVETDEIVFTLLLALRFTSIVFEETRNLSLGLASRGLDWKNLGFRGSIDVFMQLLARLMDSLFANAKAISEAVESRGYNSDEDGKDDDFFDNERGYGTQDDSKSYLRIENFVGAFVLVAFVMHFSDFRVAKMYSMFPGGA